MKLSTEIQSALKEREAARQHYAQIRMPSPVAAAMRSQIESKRAEAEGASNPEVAAALRGQIIGLEVALEREAKPVSEEAVRDARRRVIATSSAVSQAAEKQHRAETAGHWAAFAKAISVAYDALDAITDSRLGLQEAILGPVSDPRSVTARQLLCGLADACDLPVRALTPKEAERGAASRSEALKLKAKSKAESDAARPKPNHRAIDEDLRRALAAMQPELEQWSETVDQLRSLERAGSLSAEGKRELANAKAELEHRRETMQRLSQQRADNAKQLQAAGR